MDYSTVGIHDFYTFLLVFSRVIGLIATAPLLGGHTAPRPVKAGLALVLSLTLVPLVAPHTGPVPDSLMLMAGHVLKNVLFGLILGQLSRVLFAAVEIAGTLLDTQMGFGAISLFNPFVDHPESILSMFQFQLATTIFLLANGHLVTLGAISDSFNTLPPDVISPHGAVGLTILPILQQTLLIGFRLALPTAGVLMVVDMAFGLVARLVPQVNVFIVGMPAKIIVGMATVALLLPVMASIVGQIMMGMHSGLAALIAGAK